MFLIRPMVLSIDASHDQGKDHLRFLEAVTLPGVSELDEVIAAVTECRRCDRLVEWRERVAVEKRAAYRDWDYWGRPVPGFGDPDARLLIVGLAPAAHGANRTGRMFTGDRSGQWLYRALYRAKFSNQSSYQSRDDGLVLQDAFVTAIVRCAPPENRPSTTERDQCIPFLIEELQQLTQVRVVIALGLFAWEGFLRALALPVGPIRPKPKFGHEALADAGPYQLIGSYHPSQQNTSTKRLTEPMLDRVFKRARHLIEASV